MPALRRLTLEIEWHLHTIQAHYILKATPNLQKLTLRGAQELYNGQKERLFRRNFSSHASDIGFDGKTVELEHLLEFCVFKNIARLKIRKLKLFRFVLSEQMMEYVQPEELRYLQIQNCQTPSGTLSALRPERMQLHTFRFMYKNFRRDYQIYFDFIGQLKPGLQQLVCGIVVMHRFYNPEVQIELTRRLPLPFGFAEKHGDTLKYFCYHLGGKDGPTYLPDQDSEDIAPTGLWNLRELSLPLKTQKANNVVQPDYAEGEEWKSIQQPVSLTANKLDGLKCLYSLTFSPISDHYRISVLDTILNYVDSGFIQDMESGYPKPRDRRNSLMVKYVEEARLLQDFVGEVATFYGCQLPTAAGPPTLKWISFLSGYQLSEDKRFGYKVEWTLEENSSTSEKYTSRVIFVRDADTQMESEGLELRTPKIDLGGARLFS
ncbi:hypothetical protein H072_1600 [Dactylellina haptotyla CBS 200.50]|uniref:Uncharacterized protein n=1 Tax=Dactylellina haptotyla (strain CBS 200.50) TaxID=1284197 RepID=S8C9U7_DACHA|nr:hypothetical protein H072_1600 [Dactylellina haptotyla CBS 200.50]